MKTRTVRAVDVPVPREGSRQTIGSDPTVVPDTLYYRRRIASGELVEVAAPAPTPTKKGGEA